MDRPFRSTDSHGDSLPPDLKSTPSTITFLADPTPTKARVVIIGDSGVGKTSLIHRALDHEFTPSLTQTIGVDFRILRLKTTETRVPVKLEIWDTAGEERFYSITSLYFKNSPLIIMCYDRTELSTLIKLRTYWLPRVHEEVDLRKVVLILAETKGDLNLPQDKVKHMQKELDLNWIGKDGFEGNLWSKFGKPKSFIHLITSSKTNYNVRRLFEEGVDALARHALLTQERFLLKEKKGPCCSIC